MIGYLSGRILENHDGRLLVLVSSDELGETGVAYDIGVPVISSYNSLVPGEKVRLWIHTHVREDALDLYGFLSVVEKKFFKLLLTISGIGPRGALAILSGVEIPTLVRAILEEDKAVLTNISGVGKKTAERIVIELKDPLRKKDEWKEYIVQGASSTPVIPPKAVGTVSEVHDALLALGYKEIGIQSILKKIQSEILSGVTLDTGAWIRRALKEMSQ